MAALWRKYLAAYLGAGLAMAALDAVWLTLANKPVYRQALQTLLAPDFRLGPAVAFYLVYLLGVMVFAVKPALAAGVWRTAAGLGGLFGFFAYATYDLTNQATLAVWPVWLSAIDITWGTCLTAICATVGFLTGRRFGASKPG